MLGVRYGDAHIANGYIDLVVKDKDFIEEFKRCAEAVTGVSDKIIDKRGYFRITVYSKILYEFLKLSLLEDHVLWIEPDYPTDFIRGFFDSEGNVAELSHIYITNTDKEILYYINALLSMYFNIKSSVTTPPSAITRLGKICGFNKSGAPIIIRKVQHTLGIHGLDNIERFYWNIGSSILRKSNKLEYGLYERPHPYWIPKGGIV